MKMRLQKFLSQAGVASRRRAEDMIASGLVLVNGRVVSKMGIIIDSEKDMVKISSDQCLMSNVKCLTSKEKLYFIMNKPTGYVCSRSSQNKEKTIYDLLPKDLRKKVWSVGRLDKNSLGLLILTNDGELTQKLTHPKFEHEKEYEVILDAFLSDKNKKSLEKGIVIDSKKIAPAKIFNIKGKKLNIILKEGRNRQIRKMFGKMGYRVESLKRMRIGKLVLGNLPLGGVKKIKREDTV